MLCEPDTPELRTPELDCSLLRTPDDPISPALAIISPFQPEPGSPFAAEFAFELELVEEELLRIGDEVLALAVVKPVLPVDDDETLQFNWR